MGELKDDDFYYIEEGMLPEQWDSLVDFSETAPIGDTWLKESSATLEYNVIINLFHEDFVRFLESVVLISHAFDPRLVSEES
ncbi:MAG: hypothetical protein JKY52_09080 [Flavobacteriales bacterium]|nr:hypothetical protein [Flavobacteriales bacterium]